MVCCAPEKRFDVRSSYYKTGPGNCVLLSAGIPRVLECRRPEFPCWAVLNPDPDSLWTSSESGSNFGVSRRCENNSERKSRGVTRKRHMWKRPSVDCTSSFPDKVAGLFAWNDMTRISEQRKMPWLKFTSAGHSQTIRLANNCSCCGCSPDGDSLLDIQVSVVYWQE